MAHSFHLPDVGEGLVDALIVSWYVEVGDEVRLDQPLVEVETDKAVIDIPSPFAGWLLHRGGEAGDTVEVECLLAVIGEPGERWEDLEAPTRTTGLSAPPVVGSLPEADAGTDHGPLALPMVRRLAEQLGVDMREVSGSGPLGRVTESDVRAAASTGSVVRIPMTRLRKQIAENLARSWREIPHVTTFGYADADNLLNERIGQGKPPVEALLIHRLTPVLARFPSFNSAVDGDHVLERRNFHIGFAVDTPDGLMVAVVKDADGLALDELAEEVRRLAAGAKSRRLGVEDLRGQTFSISNIGAVGGGMGTPIIPYGTSAILSVGRAELRPVVRNGNLTAVRQFPLSLSYDHRLIDGAEGRNFMSAMVEAIED